MLLPLELFYWILGTFFGVLVLPTLLGWVPIVFDFSINLILWFIWVLKYRSNK